jgi:hypothetical protein
MTYVFELNHPKHYHQFKHLINRLKVDNKVIVIAREKEVLFNLLEENNVDYIKFSHSSSGNIIKKVGYHLIMLRKLLKVVYKQKPNFLLSKASVSTIFVKLFYPQCQTVIFPDSEVVWLTNHVIRHFANIIFTPEFFAIDYGKKQKRVPGIFENSYLAPVENKIEPLDISKYGYNPTKRTVFLRFVGWTANHDIKQFGFSEKQKKTLIELFEKHLFNIIISSEKSLPSQFEQYKNPLPVSKVHSLLKSCQFYVGDSQTMASEAALLGLKSFRFNSFVGEKDMSNFKYLETIGLLRNFKNFNLLIQSLDNEALGGDKFFTEIDNYWKESGNQTLYILENLNNKN